MANPFGAVPNGLRPGVIVGESPTVMDALMGHRIGEPVFVIGGFASNGYSSSSLIPGRFGASIVESSFDSYPQRYRQMIELDEAGTSYITSVEYSRMVLYRARSQGIVSVASFSFPVGPLFSPIRNVNAIEKAFSSKSCQVVEYTTIPSDYFKKHYTGRTDGKAETFPYCLGACSDKSKCQLKGAKEAGDPKVKSGQWTCECPDEMTAAAAWSTANPGHWPGNNPNFADCSGDYTWKRRDDGGISGAYNCPGTLCDAGGSCRELIVPVVVPDEDDPEKDPKKKRLVQIASIRQCSCQSPKSK